jgi:hypothetical protein
MAQEIDILRSQELPAEKIAAITSVQLVSRVGLEPTTP